MGSRGRRSSAELAVVPPARPESAACAPAALTPAQFEVWRRDIACLPPGWLAPEQGGLVLAYCRHAACADRIGAALGSLDPVADRHEFERLAALQSAETSRMLAITRALRLTVQSRSHPTTAARQAAQTRPVDAAQAVRALVDARRGRST